MNTITGFAVALIVLVAAVVLLALVVLVTVRLVKGVSSKQQSSPDDGVKASPPKGPYPNDRDGTLLNHLHGLGADLSAEHAIDFTLYCDSAADAQKAANQLHDADHIDRREAADGNGWVVVVTQDMKPSYDNIRFWSHRMQEAADKVNGKYDGWGTEPVMKA